MERVGHHGDDCVHAGSDFSGELDPQTGDGHAALDQHGSLVVDAVEDVPTEDKPGRSIPLVGDGAAAVLDDVLLGFALGLGQRWRRNGGPMRTIVDARPLMPDCSSSLLEDAVKRIRSRKPGPSMALCTTNVQSAGRVLE